MNKEDCIEEIKQILKSGGVYQAVSLNYHWEKDIQDLADTLYKLVIEEAVPQILVKKEAH